MRVRQGALGQLRCHDQGPDRDCSQAVDAQFLDDHQHDQADALEKLKAAGSDIIRVDQSYIDGVGKATKEREDKYIASDGGWFKKVVEHQCVFMTVWKQTNQYRTEFR